MWKLLVEGLGVAAAVYGISTVSAAAAWVIAGIVVVVVCEVRA